MQFAINYSPEAAELYTEGAITFDMFKCPDWPDLIAKAERLAPTYVHFPLHAGLSANDLDTRAADIAHWLNTTNTRFVNTHLYLPDESGVTPTNAETALREHLHTLTIRWGRERVIAENIPHKPGESPLRRAVVEPTLIRRVVEATDCGFLLDVSHAWITAQTLGIPPRDYISQLPVERLRELHITGIMWLDTPTYERLLKNTDVHVNWTGEQWVDHMAMTENEWELLAWALDNIRSGHWGTPWVITFEYGGVGPLFRLFSERTVIATQVPRFMQMVHGTQPMQHEPHP
nr:DUF692 family multinuclear iron-containing protein [Ardenticatena sp.]